MNRSNQITRNGSQPNLKRSPQMTTGPPPAAAQEPTRGSGPGTGKSWILRHDTRRKQKGNQAMKTESHRISSQTTSKNASVTTTGKEMNMDSIQKTATTNGATHSVTPVLAFPAQAETQVTAKTGSGYRIVNVPIDQIKISHRHRKDPGDLQALADSIRQHGLLHPIGVGPDHELLFGLRRLLACRDLLGWTTIPVLVFDLLLPDEAQYAENVVRKDLTFSERVALGKALEAKLGERRGRPKSGDTPDKYHGKRTEDVAADMCGFGCGDNYRRAKKVVDHGVQELVAAMDAGKASIAAAAQIATLPPDQQNKAVARGEDAIKAVARQIGRQKAVQRQIATVQAEKAAAALVSGNRPYVITDCQDVVQCQALISDPPYGILDEPWDVPPAELEAFTKGWLRRWNDCGADFIASFWAQANLWRGKPWFDECLTNYDFLHLLIWHFPTVRQNSPHDFRYTYDPIFVYRRKGSQKEVAAGAWGDDTNCFDCCTAGIPMDNNVGVDMKQHTAQKPIKVMRWLANALSMPGDLVVDPFAGSGSTGIAAVQLGRRFHGIEIDPTFRELAERRLAAYGVQDGCPNASACIVAVPPATAQDEARKAA